MMQGWLKWLLSWAYAIYSVIRMQYYVVICTGVKGHERMWIRTLVRSHGSLVPIHSIEQKVKELQELQTCIVVFFYRIRKRHAKYLQHEHPLMRIEPNNDDPLVFGDKNKGGE